MRLIMLALIACVLPSAGCARTTILPDPNIPHRIATETTVEVWARDPEGGMRRVSVRAMPGWWLASPQVVE